MFCIDYGRWVNDDGNRPGIDGRAWGQYVHDGREHFERVSRSWEIFRRNASELLTLLKSAENDRVAAFKIMGLLSQVTGEDEGEFQTEFWARLDQRLHNMVSSAISLVDHTRPLARFYEHEAEFSHEYLERNKRVAELPVTAFLRRLRNYLLHYGLAPTAHSFRFGNDQDSGEGWDQFEIHLSGEGLLHWPDWTAANREFISSFEPGPSLRRLAEEYYTEMASLYKWLSGQYERLHQAGVPPAHLLPPT